MSNELRVLILAAGKGVRMQSERPKVCHELAGRPLVAWVTAAVAPLAPSLLGIIVGHRAEMVRQALSQVAGLSFFEQRQQLGTGHAVQVALQALPPADGSLLVLPGDVPLVSTPTLRALLDFQRRQNNQLSFLSVRLPQPRGYGRVWRDERGNLLGIVEEKDASAEQRRIDEINSGIYVFAERELRQGIGRLGNQNVQKEYYLPDLVAIGLALGWRCQALCLAEAGEVRGVNTPQELAALEAQLARRGQ